MWSRVSCMLGSWVILSLIDAKKRLYDRHRGFRGDAIRGYTA